MKLLPRGSYRRFHYYTATRALVEINPAVSSAHGCSSQRHVAMRTPRVGLFVQRCESTAADLAGVEGFEPPNGGIKKRTRVQTDQ
jgi:hypothetical protein